MSGAVAVLWAADAWVQGRWVQRVRLDLAADGTWAAVTPDTPCPAGATVLPGPVLPGLVNAHSHAFQRAFAGQAELRRGEHDDFWSWRDRMYGVALRITPEQLHALALQLYREMLVGGYTHVCEFHYLHHAPDGRRYDDAAFTSRVLVQAAAEAGIGLTLLPVLYERAGFATDTLRDDQRRFASDVDFVLDLRQAARTGAGRSRAGVAIHSLRAARPASLQRLLGRLQGDNAPIHIHVAEQTGEVDDCIATHGLRPIEWLLREAAPDPRWQLVHATHATPAEIDGVAACGAGVVICPSTEANLGDGVPDLPRRLAAGVPLALGSDSHVGLNAAEELRWLEYAQRLLLRRRNVAADPTLYGGSTAARLFERCAAGGAQAAGFASWGLGAGAPADALVLDPTAPGLAQAGPGQWLDAWVFASGERPVTQTWVAGRCVATRLQVPPQNS